MNIKKFKECVEKYMQLDKQTLAELLAIKEMLSNIEIEAKLDEEDDYKNLWKHLNPPTPIPTPIFYPNRLINNCRNWTDCTNPHRDCVNCPLMYGHTYNTTGATYNPKYYTTDTTTPGNPNQYANTITSDESSGTEATMPNEPNNPSPKRFG